MDFTSSSDNLIVMDGKAVVARFKKGRFSTDDKAAISRLASVPGVVCSGDSTPEPSVVAERPVVPEPIAAENGYEVGPTPVSERSPGYEPECEDCRSRIDVADENGLSHECNTEPCPEASVTTPDVVEVPVITAVTVETPEGFFCECGAGPYKSPLGVSGHRTSKAHVEWVANQ